MTTAVAKKPKQDRLPGYEASPLEKASEDFIDNKIQIAELKNAQSDLADKILIEMKKEGRSKLIISHGGENWSFEVVATEEKIACRKETRTPVSNHEEE